MNRRSGPGPILAAKNRGGARRRGRCWGSSQRRPERRRPPGRGGSASPGVGDALPVAGAAPNGRRTGPSPETNPRRRISEPAGRAETTGAGPARPISIRASSPSHGELSRRSDRNIRSSWRAIRGHGLPIGEPVVQQNLQNHEWSVPTQRPCLALFGSRRHSLRRHLCACASGSRGMPTNWPPWSTPMLKRCRGSGRSTEAARPHSSRSRWRLTDTSRSNKIPRRFGCRASA